MVIKYLKYFLRDVKKYRHYLIYSTKSNLKAELSNTFLGYIWWLLDPLLHMLIYTFLVQFIFKRATPAFPVFVFTALLPWKVVTASFMKSTMCIRENAGIIKQIYLPKFILPLVGILTNTVKFFFGMIILCAMLIFYNIKITWHFVEFIPILAVFLLFVYSLCLLITHIGVFFDDAKHLMNYITMFWFFASPGMWDLDLLNESVRQIFWLNPMVAFFQSFRNVIMYGKSPYYDWLGIWLLVSIVLIFFGVSVLYRSDKNYAKVI